MPDVALTTDIIVGFPNETDEQFEETMSLYKEVGFETAYHVYLFTTRRHTSCKNGRQYSDGSEKRTSAKIKSILSMSMSAKAMKQYEGQIVEVLVEGESKRNEEVLSGYTRKNKLVNFKAPTISHWKTCAC